MFTSFILHMALGKGRSGSFLLLVLGPPCCLGRLLDLWLINSEWFLESCCFMIMFFLIKCDLLGFMSGVEGEHV